MRPGREDYAWSRREGMSVDNEFEAWEYAHLGSTSAGHFADDQFLGLHTLSHAAERAALTITFCPRRRVSRVLKEH